jgi:3-hydroxyisobutyrate dehydrogenase
MKRIGYIGLGIMGSAMATNLLKAGFEVTVWNRTRSRAKSLLERGAKWADSPAQVAATAQAVCVNVTDTPDVEQVIFGPRGIVEGNPGDTADLIIIDHSTISPAATRHFAARLAPQGIHLLDAPVTGGDVGARNATLSIMVGGDAEIFERCVPIFQAVGRTITHVGPSGLGQACKACNQVLCAVNLLGVCEALALARKEGLDLSKMLAVTMAGAGGSWSLSNLGPQIAAGDMRPGFMIDLLNKDLKIVRRESESLGLPLPAIALAAELFRAAGALGHGRDGTQAVSRAYERLAAMTYTER